MADIPAPSIIGREGYTLPELPSLPNISSLPPLPPGMPGSTSIPSIPSIPGNTQKSTVKELWDKYVSLFPTTQDIVGAVTPDTVIDATDTFGKIKQWLSQSFVQIVLGVIGFVFIVLSVWSIFRRGIKT